MSRLGSKCFLFSLAVAALAVQAVDAQGLKSPGPGSIYKEYSRVMSSSSQWRVTDPSTPNSSARQYLPNARLSLSIDDLSGATRAEAVIDVWGGHIGTSNRRFRVNGKSWISIPKITTTPSNSDCYITQHDSVVAIPLSYLRTGTNTFEATSGRQTCYAFGSNWGQWGWFSLQVRVYYGSSKPHVTGSISSPRSGATIGENPTVSCSVSGSANRVEFFARFDGLDPDGDGRFLDWQHMYHRRKSETSIVTKEHVGTDTSSPFSVVWNTDLVPNQPTGGIRLMARIRGSNGVWVCTSEVTGLTLRRTGSVKAYSTKSSIPQYFLIRNFGGSPKTKTCRFSIPSTDALSRAVSAKLIFPTWNGNNEHGVSHTIKVNSWRAPVFGQGHFFSYDKISVPLSALRSGSNTISIFCNSGPHHGIEVMWPGPIMVVRYR